MTSSNSQIAKNTLFLYMRMFFTMAVSLYTVRVIIKTLSVSDYGLYGAVGGVILTFSFITGVLTNASQRFFSVELGKGAKGRVKDVFSTLFLTYLGVSFIIIALAETVGLWFLQNKMTIPEGREDAAMWVYQFALLSFVITLLSNPYQALVIAYERMNLYAYLSILDVILKLLVVYVLLVFDYDKLKVYAVLVFISQLVTNFMYILYCKVKFKETNLVWKVDKPMFKDVFSYSSWTLFGTVAGMCNTQGINLLLNLFFGTIANAAYSIASQVYNVVGTFANNFYVAVKPPLIKSYSSNNFEYVHKLFMFSTKTLFTLLCVMTIPLMVCTNEILYLWLGQIGDYMEVFVKLSLIYVIILTISHPITAVVQAGGNVKLYHSIVDGFALIVLPIVYVIFKIGVDALWAYVVSIVVFAVAHGLRIYVMKKVFPIFDAKRYVVGAIIPMAVILSVSYFSMVFVKNLLPEGLVFTFIIMLITALIVLLLCVILLFTKTEIQMVFDMFKEWVGRRMKKN